MGIAEQRQRAVEALAAAYEAGPEELQAGQNYALCAIAEGILATHDSVTRLADEVEALRRQLRIDQD